MQGQSSIGREIGTEGVAVDHPAGGLTRAPTSAWPYLPHAPALRRRDLARANATTSDPR